MNSKVGNSIFGILLRRNSWTPRVDRPEEIGAVTDVSAGPTYTVYMSPGEAGSIRYTVSVHYQSFEGKGRRLGGKGSGRAKYMYWEFQHLMIGSLSGLLVFVSEFSTTVLISFIEAQVSYLRSSFLIGFNWENILFIFFPKAFNKVLD